MVALPLPETLPSDAELIAAARAGNDDAYGQLYTRHVGAARAAARSLTRSRALADDLVGEGFTRVLGALRNGAGPEVAFRPYLLASIRTAFYDRTRKDRRVEFTDDVEAVAAAGALELFDPRISLDERHIIAKAFASLPERWQLVLWHTEVEGRSPADVAPLLGLAPNAVAALAYRAREGLRKAYLQAHLQLAPADACRYTVERLGAYVRDGVSPREREAIDEHLEHCDSCTAMLVELRDVDSTLRRALVPLVLGVGPAVYLKAVGASSGGRAKSRSTTQMGIAAALVAALVAAGVAANADNDPPDQIAAVASTTSIPVDGTTTTTIGRTTTAAPAGISPQSVVPVGSPASPQTIPVVNAPVPGATTPTTVSRTTTTVRRTTTTVRRATPVPRQPAPRQPTPPDDDEPDEEPPPEDETPDDPTPDDPPEAPPIVLPPEPPPPAEPIPSPSGPVLTFAGEATLASGLVIRGQPVTLTVPINRARDSAPEDVVLKLRGATLPGGGLAEARQATGAEAFVSVACVGAAGSDEWRCPTASLPVGESQLTFELTVNGDLGPDDTIGGQVRIEASAPADRSSKVIPAAPVDPMAVSATGAVVAGRAVVTVEVANQSATREIAADTLVVATEAGAPLGTRQIAAVPPRGKVVESFDVNVSELASVGAKLGARPWQRISPASGGTGFRVVVTSNLAGVGAEAEAATLVWQGEGVPTASRAGAPVELGVGRRGDGPSAISWLDLRALYERPGLELVPPAGAHVVAVVPGGPWPHYSGALAAEDLTGELNISGGGSAEVVAVGRNLAEGLALTIDDVNCVMTVEAAAPATAVRGSQCPAADDGGGLDSLTATITGDDTELGLVLVLRAGLPTQPG